MRLIQYWMSYECYDIIDSSTDDRVTKVSASEVVDFGLISNQVKPIITPIGIHSFPASRSALKGQCGEQAGKFTCCAVRKST